MTKFLAIMTSSLYLYYIFVIITTESSKEEKEPHSGRAEIECGSFLSNFIEKEFISEIMQLFTGKIHP